MKEIPPKTNVSDVLSKEINWVTGEVRVVNPYSGSPVEYIYITPMLKRRELEHYFETNVDQTALEKGSAIAAGPPSQQAAEQIDSHAKPPNYPKTIAAQTQLESWWKRAKELRPQGPGIANLTQIARKIAERDLGAKSSENEEVESRANTIRKQLGQLQKVRGPL